MAHFEQGIEKFTQFLQFTLGELILMHQYSVHLDLWIFSDQAIPLFFIGIISYMSFSFHFNDKHQFLNFIA